MWRFELQRLPGQPPLPDPIPRDSALRKIKPKPKEVSQAPSKPRKKRRQEFSESSSESEDDCTCIWMCDGNIVVASNEIEVSIPETSQKEKKGRRGRKKKQEEPEEVQSDNPFAYLTQGYLFDRIPSLAYLKDTVFVVIILELFQQRR
jgi:hypothetical protein